MSVKCVSTGSSNPERQWYRRRNTVHCRIDSNAVGAGVGSAARGREGGRGHELIVIRYRKVARVWPRDIKCSGGASTIGIPDRLEEADFQAGIDSRAVVARRTARRENEIELPQVIGAMNGHRQ